MDGEPWSPLLQWFIAGRGSLEGSRHTAQLHHPKPLQAQNLTLHSLGGLQYKHINSTVEFAQAMVWWGRSEKKNKPKTPSAFINPILCMWCSSDTGLNSWTEAHTLLPVPWLLKPGHQLQHSTTLLMVFHTKVPILNEQYRRFTKTSKFISKNPGDRDSELFSYLQRKKPAI